MYLYIPVYFLIFFLLNFACEEILGVIAAFNQQ